MEDDNAKDDDQPSKKESQRMTSEQDLYNERRKYEERNEGVSNSESFTSGSYSGRSRMDMAGVRPEVPKPPSVKREAKPPEKKRRGRRPGRVEKRRKSPGRRTAVRRVPKRKSRKERELSVSTIFTRLSSRSGSRTPGCKFCGHRCCRRRFEYEEKRGVRRDKRKMKRIKRGRGKLLPQPIADCKGVQAGSRSLMLSPLCLNTNVTTPVELPHERIMHCEVTPEMIYETLRRLTMWRQYVQTAAIFDYMKRNYPVNCNEEDFLQELTHKMQIAAIVGIVMQAAEGYWCLHCALQNRSLGKTHVTKFWQVYGDTMRPIKRRIDDKKKKAKREDKSSLNKRGTSELQPNAGSSDII